MAPGGKSRLHTPVRLFVGRWNKEGPWLVKRVARLGSSAGRGENREDKERAA